ncbi:hypothetical protein PM3016_5446 [Paenibacillus mucilaginosus 3016]|uniref:SEC-C motif domain-containing protein n=1 Tax=Paenibacillus mucilaginosus 3016 TaxID=1116391 RepID=H6NDU7_9BACL|nr:SEC-C domain-containing protein [Paenibacillus mucilaginosus]AFC32146.1 hypothetical protein PM3016_5446 [Paenibacillus mucilaginosus 3016]WFA20648.1 SEC-C domain-containing protein [Paenibacillus mucilaginosus]
MANKIGRNDLCFCGSGLKYKRCCINKKQEKRKYLAEFALHTYSSHASIFYPNDMGNFDFSNFKYHIYMINLIPRLTFVKDTLRVAEEAISVAVRVQTETADYVEDFNFKFKSSIDHRTLNIEFDKPLRSIQITDSQGKGTIFRVLPFYLRNTPGKIDCEILYIGQSFGKEGERQALDRLKSHSTLQEIQSDLLFNGTVRDLAISLWEFTPKLFSLFDGKSKVYDVSESEDIQHMMQIIKDPPLHINKQIINITEAALINYFKPEFNDKLKNNFPDVNHSGYKEYYDLDYNSLIVEIDPETISANMYTKEKNYNILKPIQYGLHPENVRKSMFEIFE